MDGVAREIRLVARPQGFPDEDLFEVAEMLIPDPADGQVLIRNAYFSVDPNMRPRMNDVRSYVAPFTLGEAMTGGAVGRVVSSQNPRYAEGDWVVHQLGWREWALSDGSALRKLDPEVAPISTALAFSGCRASRRGTGSASSARRPRVRRSSCRVLRGLSAVRPDRWRASLVAASSERGLGAKAGVASRAGIRRVFHYREQSPRHALAELAPDGIDVYFDNVGGDHLECGDRRPPNPRARGRLRLDLALQRRRAGAGTAEHVPRRDETSPHFRDTSSATTTRGSASSPSRRPPGYARVDFAIARRSSRGSRTPRRRSSAFFAARTSGRCWSRSALQSEASLPALRPSPSTSPAAVLPDRALSAMRALWQARAAAQPLTASQILGQTCGRVPVVSTLQLGHPRRRRSGGATAHCEA